MKNLSSYIHEATSSKSPKVLSIPEHNEFWKDYVLKNRVAMMAAMAKYWGELKNITFRMCFSGKDDAGKPISGVKLSYVNKSGQHGDAYISDDGYVVNVSTIFTRGVPKSEFSKNTYYHILPDVNVKLK